MTLPPRFSRIGLFFVASLLCFGPSTTSALDTVWTYRIPETLYAQHYGNQYFSMSNIEAQVAYHASGRNTATGESVCDASIPVGTSVRFSFTPHTYADIFWFGTGNANDSPYGDWVAGGASDGNICQDKNFAYYQPAWRWTPRYHYIELAINPPAGKTITPPASLFDCGAAAADGSVTCVARRTGTENTLFAVPATYGYFHKALIGDGVSSCFVESDLYVASGAPYRLEVPSQSMSCAVTVRDATDGGGAPNPPTVSTDATCRIGESHAFTIRATDPDGDPVQYLVDWDADGTTDQILPASGYIPSGTALVATRLYATAGTKTVRFAARDSTGRMSSWYTTTLSCATTPGRYIWNLGPWSNCFLGKKHRTVSCVNTANGENVSLNLCPRPVPSDFVACDSDDDGGVGTDPVLPPDVVLRVVPSLVRSGDHTEVTWNAVNVDSCEVRADANADRWSGAHSPVGGEQSSPITARTTYSLACTDSSGTPLPVVPAVVSVIPSWSEQ